MSDLRYPMIIKLVSEEDGGGYIAQAPDLKGCLGDGNTPEEALTNLKDAIIEWIDEARRLQRQIPQPGESVVRARTERQRLFGVVRKQEELISQQAELLDHLRNLRSEIAQLREQIAELSDSAHQDDSEPVWASPRFAALAQ